MLTCVAPERRRESFPQVAIGSVQEVVHVPGIGEVLAGDFVFVAGPVLVFTCAGGVLSAGSVCSLLQFLEPLLYFILTLSKSYSLRSLRYFNLSYAFSLL